MKLKGFIDKVNYQKRIFDVIVKDEIFTLFFEEISNLKFNIGDEILFDESYSNEFGKCVINPELIANRILDELSNFHKENITIIGFVFNEIKAGYEVSYKGYRCFLPLSEGVLNGKKLYSKDLLNQYQLMHVIKIKKKRSPIVSIKQISQKDSGYLKQQDEVLIELKEFTGIVKKVHGYGVFISYKISQGLLPIGRIIPGYDINGDKIYKEEIESKIKSIFSKGTNVNVFIDEINFNNYLLDWNREDISNAIVIQKLNDVL